MVHELIPFPSLTVTIYMHCKISMYIVLLRVERHNPFGKGENSDTGQILYGCWYLNNSVGSRQLKISYFQITIIMNPMTYDHYDKGFKML